MKKTTLFLALAAMTTGAFAGTSAPVTTSSYSAPPADMFGPGWAGSLYGLGIAQDGVGFDEYIGGGAALDYYFTDYVALGVLGELADIDGEVGGVYAFSTTFRYPMGTYFAPYLTAAAGIQDFNDTEILGRAGAGLQVKFTPTFGAFADWIYSFPGGGGGDDDFEDYQTIRAGLTFNF